MSFKLIAIRPINYCGINFLKNLELNRIYKIYNEYEFISESKLDTYSIKKTEYFPITKIIKELDSVPSNFFGEKISVSAIVGKNGSGKSSLINLLVGALNQFSLQLQGREIMTTAELQTTGAEERDKVYCEIFYEIGEAFYCLKVEDEECSIINVNDQSEIQFDNFFYTNIINYSLYAFNSWELGDWVDKLFHKNDAYQIPIVINPKRGSKEDGEAGILDVNNENYLLQQRLLSIILLEPQYEITSNLIVDNLKLKTKEIRRFKALKPGNDNWISKLDEPHQFEKLYMNYLKGDYGFTFDYRNATTSSLIYSNLHKVLKDFKNHFGIEIIKVPAFQAKLDLYILYKITSICDKYISYNDFLVEGIKYGEITSREINLDKFLNKFSDSNSHIVIKLKQVVNFIKFYDEIWSKFILDADENHVLVSELAGLLISISKKKKVQILELLPPPIFETFLYSGKEIDILNKISSGEMQMVTSITSILYHLNNLNSVEKEEKIKKYNYVNLILDEVELYFHPEYQRNYLKKLLNDITKFNLPEIKYINILIISHSPFILSDIPKQNVLFLEINKERGFTLPQQYHSDNTFGENIHEILSHGFFLHQTIGAFAKSKIDEFLEFEKKHSEIAREQYIRKRDDFVKLINLIGEDVIKQILINHLSRLDERFLPNERIIKNIEDEIKILQAKLKNEQNKLSN